MLANVEAGPRLKALRLGVEIPARSHWRRCFQRSGGPGLARAKMQEALGCIYMGIYVQKTAARPRVQKGWRSLGAVMLIRTTNRRKEGSQGLTGAMVDTREEGVLHTRQDPNVKRAQFIHRRCPPNNKYLRKRKKKLGSIGDLDFGKVWGDAQPVPFSCSQILARYVAITRAGYLSRLTNTLLIKCTLPVTGPHPFR